MFYKVMNKRIGAVGKWFIIVFIIWIVINYLASHILDSNNTQDLSELQKQQQILQQEDHKMNGKQPSTLGPQDYIDYLSRNLNVRYDVLSNTEGPLLYSVCITLTNTGSVPVTSDHDWAIYLFSFVMPEQTRMKTAGFNVGVDIEENKFHIRHIQGYLYELKPASRFLPILPGSQMKINYHTGRSSVSRFDHFPNWYVASPGATPKILESTKSEKLDFIGAFDSPEKWKRGAADIYDPFTPDIRYIKHKVDDLGRAASPVVPTPLKWSMEKGTVTLGSHWKIVHSTNLKEVAEYLSVKLRIPLASGDLGDKKSIELSVDHVDVDFTSAVHQTQNEAYFLRVQENTITIKGNTEIGVFYGIQSLLSMNDGLKVPLVTMTDAPRFPYRGFMLDVCRNFYPVAEVKRVIDLLAAYKLNKLHLHLSEDEAWRLEIPGLPELTEVGSQRGHDLSEQTCLVPQLGSGPHPGGLGSGFYTTADYRDILRYAKSKHIQVIPEIDMPGHCHAAIKSMEARRKRLLQEGRPQEDAERYLLSDLADKSKYSSPQRFTDGALNPCLPSVYNFVDHVMTALVEMHKDIQPLTVYHLGGDEVPKGTYTESPVCEKFKKQNPQIKNQHHIKEYFLKRVGEIAAKHKLDIQAWEDGFYGGAHVEKGHSMYKRENFAQKNVTANFWLTIPDYGRMHEGNELANHGYKVVLSHGTHLYFDHPYEPDPEERGLYWATRYIDTEKVFNIIAGDMYSNIETDKFGRKLTREKACAKDGVVRCVPLEKPENIIGLQGQVWTELIRTPAQLYEMLLPRLLALAERAWHRPAWESLSEEKRNTERRKAWAEFANTLGYKEIKRLEEAGYFGYLPAPGARITGGILEVCTAYPGLQVQYSVDDGKTWSDLPQHYQPDRSKPLLLATRSQTKSDRRSKTVLIPALST